MNRPLGLSIAVATLVLLGLVVSCVYVVAQTQQVLLVSGGAPSGIVNEPGIHFKWPLQRAIFFDRMLLNLDAKNEEVITLDKKRAVVDAFARWRIVDPLLFYQSQLNSEKLAPFLSSNIRRALGSQDFSVLLSGRRAQLTRQIRDNLNGDVKGFGIVVADVRIRRADVPKETRDSIYQRMKKERERQAAEYRAEGDEIAQGIKARAEREVTVIKAEATRQAAVLRGEGDADKIRITAASFNQDPNFYAFWRSMQAYQEALPGSNTTLILTPKSDFLKYIGEGPGGSAKK